MVFQKCKNQDCRTNSRPDFFTFRINPLKTLRPIFSPTVELLLKGSALYFIIFYFQQLLFLTNFDQTHGYRDRIEAILYLHTKFFFFLHLYSSTLAW
jgi:hypothetical protein